MNRISKKNDTKSKKEIVGEYPRPPRLERTDRHLQVWYSGGIIADTHRGYRVLETGHPPGYYFPPQDVNTSLFVRSDRVTLCEWKGKASYFHLFNGSEILQNAVWTYVQPREPYGPIAGYFAFYPALMDRCTVDGEPVKAQPGGFYGGWITSDLIGPFKGEAGFRGY